MNPLSYLLDRFYSLLPRRKPNPTCGLMLLWSLPPDKAKILVDYLDAQCETMDHSGLNPDSRNPDDPVEYLEVPDWI